MPVDTALRHYTNFLVYAATSLFANCRTTAATLRLVQLGVSVRTAEETAKSQEAMESAEAVPERADGFTQNYVQASLYFLLGPVGPARTSDDGRIASVDILRRVSALPPEEHTPRDLQIQSKPSSAT